jgi:hypothetical protein
MSRYKRRLEWIKSSKRDTLKTIQNFWYFCIEVYTFLSVNVLIYSFFSAHLCNSLSIIGKDYKSTKSDQMIR